jgi:hypothetical protein
MNEKYTIISNNILGFDQLFDISEINMSYYFSNCFNNGTIVKGILNQLGLKGVDIHMYATPNKGEIREYSDIENMDSTIYNHFTYFLLKKAHERNCLPFHQVLNSKDRKGYMLLSHLRKQPIIEVNYYTKIVALCFTFGKDGLKIVYTLNSETSNKLMLDIHINKKNEILSTTVYFNGKIYKEPEKINLNHKQLDYLIALCHYGMIEENDFNVETYIDKVLAENYKDILDYFKVKEMTYI